MLLRTIVEALGKRARRKERSVSRKNRQERRSSPKRTNMPLAYALARSWAWPALKFRCETHPQEVMDIAVDNRGETILHWTCLGKPPIDTVQAILKVCPFMAQVRNKVGHLPLHVAISYRASVQVVRALLEAFPESAGMPNGVGAYPLHLLCDYGSCVDSLSAVLETKEGAATINVPMKGVSTGERAQTALTILNSRMNYPAFRRAIESMREARERIRQQQKEEALQRQNDNSQQNHIDDMDQPPSQAQPQQPRWQDNLLLNSTAIRLSNETNHAFLEQTNEYWQKAALLVWVSYTQQPLSPQGLQDPAVHIVHACAGIPLCPSYLLEFASLLHWDDLMQRRDAEGRLPLHVAARNHAHSLVHVNRSEDIRRRKRRRQMGGDALCMILEACPRAACVQDSNGDLPLAVALNEIQSFHNPNDTSTSSKTWSSSLQRLLDANVAALETLNLEEGLYPFLWAQRMTSVDQLFQSIRRHPNLFHQQRDSEDDQMIMDRTAGC